MPTDSKFKKVRLFKVSRELNVSVDHLVEHLTEAGYEDALTGSGLNAAITDEDAYENLLDFFADDAEVAARLSKKRAARREAEAIEAGDGADDSEPVVEPAAPKPEPEPEPEVEAEKEPEAVEEEEVSEPEPEPEEEEEPVEAVAETVEEKSAEEEIEISEAAEIEEDEATLAEAAESAAEAAAEAETTEEVEPVAEKAEAKQETTEPPAEKPQAGKREAGTPEAEAKKVEEKAEEEEAPAADEAEAEEDEEEAEGTLTADRYKLEGTKVLGKLDLSAFEEERKSRKRKRKRKRISGTGSSSEPDKKDRKSKKKKKGKGKVDEQDVEAKMQETLRELEMGASRARQRRRRRRREQHAEQREKAQERRAEEESVLEVTEFVSTGELANLMDVDVNDVISTLFSAGMMVSINQRLDADTISFVADEYGMEVEFITDFTTTDILVEDDDPEDMVPRSPVVTVMGHVDHGKTSLLDYIRSEDVVSGEAGGITQHIGAYQVELKNGKKVTFLDTPGHEAFTAMRARGAQVTDVVILVVAADDAVMPQTIEAINHAQAAGVPIVVAINKIDKPEANDQRVMQQLADQNVLVEQYGGKVQAELVSAMTGQGIPELLDRVLLEAELMELKANPDRNAVATVIESRLEKGRGNVATVLVQRGTLRVGDAFVAGIHSGRVRAMFDERNNRVEEVGPSQPSLVLGLDGSPEVGDSFIVLDDEKEVKDIAANRQQIHREQSLRQHKHITLDEIGRRLALGEFQELNLIVKGDVAGSVEALSDSLMKLGTEEVVVNIIHKGVGAINESDVMLASASDAIIIGFQVRPVLGARQLAEREEIDIRLYSVIYHAIEEVRDALEGLLSPEKHENILGTAEVREIFKVPKIGTVAGCHVKEGKIRRSDRIHLIREGVVIYDGTLASLKRFKDDVREVQSGYECGMGIENFNDIKVGDEIEAYEIVETARTLDD